MIRKEIQEQERMLTYKNIITEKKSIEELEDKVEKILQKAK